jgi:6-phosphogluconolactonase
MGGVEIETLVVSDPEAAAAAAARLLADAAAHGADIALAGGSTPRRAYELAAELCPDWSRAAVWWGDERCVPREDERSNYRLVREALLDRLHRPPRAVNRIRGELPAAEAAEAYDAEVANVNVGLVLLGVGPDGHTASLFPNSPALAERERSAVPAEPKLEPFVDRVTLTIPKLNAATEVVFLVAGEEKAEAVARAFKTPPSPATPASLVRSQTGKTTVILDEAAASRL